MRALDFTVVVCSSALSPSPIVLVTLCSDMKEGSPVNRPWTSEDFTRRPSSTCGSRFHSMQSKLCVKGDIFRFNLRLGVLLLSYLYNPFLFLTASFPTP